MRQFDTQNGGLQFVEARIHPDLVRYVMGAPAILPDRRQPRCQRRVAGGDHPAIAERAKVLGRIEAERASRAERAKAPAVQFGAVRLGAVLDQRDAEFAAKRQDRVEVGSLAVEMHHDHRGDRRQARRRMAQHGFQLGRVEREEYWIYIDQHRRRAGHLDRRDRRDRGVGNSRHRHAGANSETAQRQGERVGAVGASDRRTGAEKGSELGLEGASLAAEDVPAGIQRAGHCRVDLGLQCAVAGAGIGLRDDGHGNALQIVDSRPRYQSSDRAMPSSRPILADHPVAVRNAASAA